MKKLNIKVDNETKGYIPFVLLFIVLVTGMVILCMNISKMPVWDLLNDNYGKLLLATITLEVVLLQFIFPDEKIIMGLDKHNVSYKHYREDRSPINRNIVDLDYWWAYNGFDFSVFVKLVDDAVVVVVLYEDMPNWRSIPHWRYSTETYGEEIEKYRCFDLLKVGPEIEWYM